MSVINGIQATILVGEDGRALLVDGEALKVAIVDIEGGTVELTGEVAVDTWGGLDDAAEDDPDALSATIPSLLRGSLGQQLLAVAALGDPEDDTPVTDTAAVSASITGLLRGILGALQDIQAELEAQTTHLATIAGGS